jgi:YVTN family beta-propeller protein
MPATTTHRVRRSRAVLAAVLCAAGLPVAAVLTASAAAAAGPTAPIAYVINTTGGSVSPVDTTTNQAGTAIPVAQGPIAVAITPDGATAYVLSGVPSEVVTPIDTATNAPGTPIPVADNSVALAITPDGATVYVGNAASGTGAGAITPIDTANNTAGPAITFPLPISPRAIAITPDGTTAYVGASNNTVYPIAIATNALGSPIPVGSLPQDIAITPDGSLAFVADFNNDVTPINLLNNTADTPIAVVGHPYSIAITPDGASAFVTTSSGGTVPISIATGTAGSPIATPGFGAAIAITPDGTTAYVDDVAGNTVVPITVATQTVGTPIAVEEAPQGIAISPDQAPVAHLTVTPAAPGAATGFDASASTVKYGTITSYAWNFGDGVTTATATPTTTHTYATGGNYPASVTETDSAGTSTARVFTGRTMSRNGGPQATATATVSIAGPAAWTAYVVNNLDNTVTPINLRTLVAGPPIPVGAGPGAVAITPDAKTAYVANGDANTVTPINTATNAPGPAIHVGSDPFSIAITPDGTTAWVANTGDGTVTPINVATNTAGAPLTIPLGVSGVTVSPDGATLYATGDPNVTPVNLATNTVGASFGNSGNPRATAITPNGSKLLTANSNNFLAVHDTTTQINTTDFVLNALAGDVAITPNGATAYVAYTGPGEGGLVPVDVATGNPGAKIKTGQAGFGTAITPDGKTAIVTNLFDHSVTLVSTATNTAGATIQVGTNPFAVAVTPDQAPIARLHVARAPLGQPATLDASASTTPFGTRTAYVWDFGDGAKTITLSPITQHIYNEATDTASVTVINSANTSSGQTFTGRTVSNNGSASATAYALGSLAGSGPVVNAVLPAAGPTGGGTHVTITGSNLAGATSVEFNGKPATFTQTSSTSLLATTPAEAVAQNADVVVTTAAGSSATTPADRFTFTNATPAKSCSSALCVIVVRIPVVPYTASATMSTSCGSCTVTASAGLGALGGACGATPQFVTTTSSNVSGTAVSQVIEAFTHLDLVFGGLAVVCAQTVLGAAPVGAGTAATAAATPATITLRTCAQTNGTAPCIMDDTATNGARTTRIKLPANKKFKLEVTPVAPVVTKVTPISSGIGPLLQITGTNTGNVMSVVIGGQRAPIVFRLPKSIVVGIPAGAQSGPISLITATGVVTANRT